MSLSVQPVLSVVAMLDYSLFIHSEDFFFPYLKTVKYFGFMAKLSSFAMDRVVFFSFFLCCKLTGACLPLAFREKSSARPDETYL